MLGVYVLAATLTAPSPPPMKTIGHAYASPFCTALHQQVAPAVRDLVGNKAVVTSGKDVFLDMARDAAYGTGGRVDLNMQRINDLITPMVENLAATDAALDRLAKSNDARLAQIRAQLEAVAGEQRKMLNVFSGTYASFSSNELAGNNPESAVRPVMRDDVAKGVPIVTPDAPAEPNGAQSAGATMPTPAPSSTPTRAPAPAASVRVIDMGLAGGTAFAQLYNQITTYQLRELALESRAAASIQQSATLCR